MKKRETHGRLQWSKEDDEIAETRDVVNGTTKAGRGQCRRWLRRAEQKSDDLQRSKEGLVPYAGGDEGELGRDKMGTDFGHSLNDLRPRKDCGTKAL